MIQKGYCSFCGKKFDAEPNRANDGTAHNDCRRNSNILKNLGISEKNIIEVLEGRGVLTTEKYWDCNCLKDFIHPKSQKMCYECGAVAEEQPDSRVSEVMIAEFSLEDKDNSEKVAENVGNSIKDNYPYGICPDCKEPIPDNAVSGQKCGNCGHIFY